jgi:hypothetical protein
MSDQQRINGATPDWSSIRFLIGDQKYFGVKQIDYSDSRTSAKTYGAGRHFGPRGKTPGKYAVDPCTTVVEKATADALREQLAQADGSDSFGNTEVDILVQYTVGNDTITDEVRRCTWSKSTVSHSGDSEDALYETIEWDPMFIVWNGRTLYDGRDGDPS